MQCGLIREVFGLGLKHTDDTLTPIFNHQTLTNSTLRGKLFSAFKYSL